MIKYDEEIYHSLYRSLYPDRMHHSGCPDLGMQFNITSISTGSRHSRHNITDNITCNITNNGSSFDAGRNVPARFDLV
jgi:hypothetical protein